MTFYAHTAEDENGKSLPESTWLLEATLAALLQTCKSCMVLPVKNGEPPEQKANEAFQSAALTIKTKLIFQSAHLAYSGKRVPCHGEANIGP